MTNAELPLEETEETEPVAEAPAEPPVVAAEVEEPEAPYVQPEPTIVGHSVVQDNTSEPGTQHTRAVDGTITSSAVS